MHEFVVVYSKSLMNYAVSKLGKIITLIALFQFALNFVILPNYIVLIKYLIRSLDNNSIII